MSYQDFTNFKTVLTTLASTLASLAPTRLVTRELMDFERRDKTDRAGGVFTILAGPRTGYNYEHRPGDLPRVQIFIYGEYLLTGKFTGVDIDDAEDNLARDLERLANQAPHVPGLEPIVLESITPSAQTAPPFAQVLAVFVYGVDR